MLLAKHLELQKALVVIDDANESQLQLLLPLEGAGRKLHPKSIVLITSRDRSALEQRHIFVYRVELLHKELAARLFAAHAFPASRQPVVLGDLAQNIVSCCGGMPLTLKVSNPSHACLQRRSRYKSDIIFVKIYALVSAGHWLVPALLPIG